MRAVNKNVPYYHENHLYSLRHSRFNPPQPISCDRYHTSRHIFKILIISLLPHNPGTTNLLNTEFFICSPAYNKLSAKSFSNDNCLRFQGCYPHRPLTLRRSAYWKAFSPSLDREKNCAKKFFFHEDIDIIFPWSELWERDSISLIKSPYFWSSLLQKTLIPFPFICKRSSIFNMRWEGTDTDLILPSCYQQMWQSKRT